MDYIIREMKIDDYEQAYRLWERIEGLSRDESDCKEGIPPQSSVLIFRQAIDKIIIRMISFKEVAYGRTSST